MIRYPQSRHACPERTRKAGQRVKETVSDDLIEPTKNREANQSSRDLYDKSKNCPDSHFDKLEIPKRRLVSFTVVAKRCGHFLSETNLLCGVAYPVVGMSLEIQLKETREYLYQPRCAHQKERHETCHAVVFSPTVDCCSHIHLYILPRRRHVMLYPWISLIS